MCYSAQITANYKHFVRMFGATMSLHEFFDTFWRRANDPQARIKIPKAMEHAFDDPKTDEEREIKAAIEAFRTQERTRFEQELFAQRKRLADAERVLAGPKPTKAAAESQRIAPAKIAAAMAKLADLRRTTLEAKDSRIFPGVYAPVLVIEDGVLKVLPMRYQCRPEGRPATYDQRFPGTYNARRDNLEGSFWRDVFGYRHGLIVASAFYEHVKRHRVEGRELAEDEKEEDVVLEFKPQDGSEMLVACLWSRWQAPEQPDLLSFAAITDEPPPEVLAAGHDRCIVPIQAQNVDRWLRPDAKDLSVQYAILDDRARPYYEHQLAA